MEFEDFDDEAAMAELRLIMAEVRAIRAATYREALLRQSGVALTDGEEFNAVDAYDALDTPGASSLRAYAERALRLAEATFSAYHDADDRTRSWMRRVAMNAAATLRE